jgi:hypothetical protein
MPVYKALIQLHLKADDTGTPLDKPWVGDHRPAHNEELTVDFHGQMVRARVLNTYVPLQGVAPKTAVLPVINLLKI